MNGKFFKPILIILAISCCFKGQVACQQKEKNDLPSDIVPSASNFYVSVQGNDNNVGTISSPWRTMQKGVGVLKAGDTLFVREGVYVEVVTIGTFNSGSDNAPVVVMAYQGESPVIDEKGVLPSSDWAALLTLSGNYIHVSGFEVRNTNSNNNYGVLISGQHNIVSRLNVHHSNTSGIFAGGDYSVVEDCTVWQNVQQNANAYFPSVGRQYGWSTGLAAARDYLGNGITEHFIIRRNTVFNNWGEGLDAYEASDGIVEDNVVYDNWSVNLYVSNAWNIVVQRNLVYVSPNTVITGERRIPSNITLSDELETALRNPSIHPKSRNNKIVNNLLINSGFSAFGWTAVNGSGLESVLIANNTLINGQLWIGTDAKIVHSNSSIVNNIFFNENSDPWNVGNTTNISFSNNCWSKTPPSSLSGTGDVVGDPLISKIGSVDAGKLTGEYFKLTNGSPAIDKGISIDVVKDDFFGKERKGIPDIGGIEF